MSDSTTRLSAALRGRYHVERQLGEGGMATVYLARDEKHNRHVAVKVLKPELAAVVGAERFLAEIETTANLHHPHILPLFDSGEADGFLFYVMPYVAGESLRDRLTREHQLPVEQAVRIATNVAEALDYAHRAGVIHRDIKPANILLQDGTPMVSDFGIALAVGVAGGGRLTETGLSLGTPHYMSPEQAAGDTDVGPTADVYALGCVLFEMLLGDPPFTGSTAQAILGKVLSSEPASASASRHTVPIHVDAAIRKALEKLPADRFTSAAGFSAALSETGFRHGSSPTAVRAGPGASLWKRAALGLAALSTLLVAGMTWVALRPDPPRPVVRSALPLPPGLRLETIPGAAFALSPDGSRVVFSGTTGTVTQLWQRSLSDLDSTPIPGTEGARTPVYSPDGTEVAFISAGRLLVVSLTGAPPLTLVDGGVAAGASGLSWSADGWIYFRPTSESGLRRVREGGGGSGEIVTTGPGEDLHPEAIPGGRGLLFTRSETRIASEVVLRDLESGEERSLFEGRTARYASSGHIVYSVEDGTLHAVPFDARRLEVVGAPRPLFAGVQTDPVSGGQFALSRAGALVYQEGTGARGLSLAEVGMDGSARMLPLPPRDFSGAGPSWSPDGATIAFSSDLQIYTYDTSLNTAPRQVTFEGSNTSPVFSPDGRRIAFSSAREGSRGWDLFVKDLASDSPPRLAFAADGGQIVTDWPLDTLLLFEHAVDPGARDLWTLDLSRPDSPEASPYLSSGADLSSLVLSPDGTKAAHRWADAGREEVHLRDFPDPREPLIVLREDAIPFWSPDGNSVLLGTRIGRMFVSARLARGAVFTVASVDTLFADPGIAGQPMAGASMHPDGDRFVFVVNPSGGEVQGDASGAERLILVQGFEEELRRLAPPN